MGEVGMSSPDRTRQLRDDETMNLGAANLSSPLLIVCNMNRSALLRCGWLIAALAWGWQSGSAQTPVRHLEGSLHGFLSLSAQDGKVAAVGELSQVARGSTVTGRLIFHFRDGSLDDETTVFSERGTFRLISYHHIQTGPSFPKPTDLTIDMSQGRVTSRSPGKDGAPVTTSYTMKLPPDLANGLVSIIAKNIRPDTPMTKVPMLVLTPKPLVVTLAISPSGQDPYDFLGVPHKALHYAVQIQLGGLTGVVATLIGKHPPDIQLWILPGDGPTFLREVGPSAQDGPVWTMQLASPNWPEAPHPAP